MDKEVANLKSELYELLFVSTLASDKHLNCVGGIATKSRIANSSHDITGILLFDGENFAEHLEGKQSSIDNLFGKICSDERHFNVLLLHKGPIMTRNYPAFAMGYAITDDIDGVAALKNLHGVAAINEFLKLVSASDLEPHVDKALFASSGAESLSSYSVAEHYKGNVKGASSE